MATPEDWSEAAAALRSGRWSEAATAYAALAAATGDPRAHEGLAQVGWWLDDADTALGAREDAYRGFRAAGDDTGAARAAAALAYDSVLFGRGVAVGRGWLARAADLLAGRADVPEAGWLALREAELALNVDRDPVAALAAADRAREVGRLVEDGELVIVSGALAGLARVRSGDVTGGMPLLDGAVAAATAGDVADLMWMGKICCWLVNACQETHDLGRAADWCSRVQDICAQRDLAPLLTVCRTQYASILLARGDSGQAESTLVDVLAGLEGSRRASRLDAVVQLGELRRRQGRLDEAETLLGQAAYRPDAAISRARLELDRGDPERAWAVLAEVLRSISPHEVLERVDALAVAVEAGVAAGLVTEAADAAAELDDLASRLSTPAARARAAVVAARLAPDDEDVERWQDAVRALHTAGLSFDEAESRHALASALRRRGDATAAAAQEAAARAVLGPLRAGATTDTGAAGLTRRQVEVLALLAQGLTNAEIAARLHLSEHTVHRHLANIYTTLDLGSRAAAAAYAVRHGLTRETP